MKEGILVTRTFSKKWMEYLEERFDLTVWNGEGPADRSWILDNIKEKAGAFVMLTDRIDREVIDASSALRAISTMSVGLDHIDVDYARKKGISVSNTPDVLTEATADLGFALLLGLVRRVVEGDRLVRSGNWTQEWAPDFMTGHDFGGKTLGIYGMGRIGSAVMRRAAAFGMSVIYNSRKDREIEQAQWVSYDDLMRNSDYLMVCVSLDDRTRGSIDHRAISMMKSNAYLVNISRGAVVNQDDLLTALKQGKLAGAALDVYERAPTGKSNPLFELPNTVLTPHLGSATVETRARMAELAAKNLVKSLGA